jgi:hypothetical protein
MVAGTYLGPSLTGSDIVRLREADPEPPLIVDDNH